MAVEDEDDEMEYELFAHNFESLCRIQTMKAPPVREEFRSLARVIQRWSIAKWSNGCFNEEFEWVWRWTW